ncbi:MAG: elongation factor Ts [Minisyncoccia bacterium]
MISLDLIQKLREITGAGIMDCKKALEEAQGDLDEAKKILFEKGSARVELRKDKKTGAGILEAYIHNNRIGVLLELRCETDFVARLDDFKNLAHEIAMQIAAMDPKDVNELLTQPYIKDESITVGDLIKKTQVKLGENMQIGSFSRLEL